MYTILLYFWNTLFQLDIHLNCWDFFFPPVIVSSSPICSCAMWEEYGKPFSIKKRKEKKTVWSRHLTTLPSGQTSFGIKSSYWVDLSNRSTTKRSPLAAQIWPKQSGWATHLETSFPAAKAFFGPRCEEKSSFLPQRRLASSATFSVRLTSIRHNHTPNATLVHMFSRTSGQDGRACWSFFFFFIYMSYSQEVCKLFSWHWKSVLFFWPNHTGIFFLVCVWWLLQNQLSPAKQICMGPGRGREKKPQSRRAQHVPTCTNSAYTATIGNGSVINRPCPVKHLTGNQS